MPGSTTEVTIPGAKILPDSTSSSISLNAKVVTYASADYFYIEEDNRGMGIRVEKIAHGLSVHFHISLNISSRAGDY
ncbi:MAG: hypothetical protein NT018_05930 [Armatimonadetes bacterium]|nr:hypothetical protein [Armatimonadota bacterium]